MSVRQLAALGQIRMQVRDPGSRAGPRERPACSPRASPSATYAQPWAVRMRLGQSPAGAGTAGPGPEPGQYPGPGPGRSRSRLGTGTGPEPGALGTGPGDAPADQFIPVGLTVPFHDGAVSGALYLMAFVHTGAGPRFFAVWNLRTPALQDATLIPLAVFTVTDDRGTGYRLEFTPSGDSGWTSELGLRPAAARHPAGSTSSPPGGSRCAWPWTSPAPSGRRSAR